MDNLDLSAFFTTKAQAGDFSARISAIEEKTFETDFNLEDELHKQFGIKKKDSFITLLRDNDVPTESGTALNKFFAKIQETISSMPEATLTLAIEPNDQLLKEMSDWFLLNLKKQILIEIQIEPNVIAGAAIGYNGKYCDSSIKAVFDEIFSKSLTDNPAQSKNP